jgi:hypothetical protein
VSCVDAARRQNTPFSFQRVPAIRRKCHHISTTSFAERSLRQEAEAQGDCDRHHRHVGGFSGIARGFPLIRLNIGGRPGAPEVPCQTSRSSQVSSLRLFWRAQPVPMRDREVVEGVAAAAAVMAAAECPTPRAAADTLAATWICAARLTTGARSASLAIRRRRTLRRAPILAVGIPRRFMADRIPTEIEMSASAEMATRQRLVRIDPRPR